MAFWLITKSIKRYGKTSREQSLPVPPRRVTAPPHPKCSSESSGSPQAPAAIKSVLIKYIVVLGEQYVAMCVVLRRREVTDMHCDIYYIVCQSDCGTIYNYHRNWGGILSLWTLLNLSEGFLYLFAVKIRQHIG